jgi:hypothetical protein
MSKLNKTDYLKLIQEYTDQQYGDALDDYNIAEMEWIPAEPEIKQKLTQPINNATVDLLNVPSDKIKEEMVKGNYLIVGKFKIKVNRYQGTPTKDGTQLTMSIKVWEMMTHTPNGHPCKIDFPMHFHKDNRFNTRPWIQHFNADGEAWAVPVDTMVEIIRWMQAVKKLSAFL